MEYSVLISGKSGQGLNTFKELLDKALKLSGFYLTINGDYISGAKDRQNFIQITFSEKPISSHSQEFDIIFALNEEAILEHGHKLKKEGIIFTDNSIAVDRDVLHLPLFETTTTLRNIKAYNVMGFSAILKHFNIPIEIGVQALKEVFPLGIYRANVNSLRVGYNMMD